jgi:hypothetical protein
MEIYLGTLVLPVAPERLVVEWEAHRQTYTPILLGEVEVARGRKPVRVSWPGLLPGRAREGMAALEGGLAPEEVVATIEGWLAANQVLGLVITEAGVGLDVFIERFEARYRGGHGDVEYEIALVEDRPVVIGMTAVPDGAFEPGPGARSVPDLYVVIGADESLWVIAKRVYGDGSRAGEILAANVDQVGPDGSGLRAGQVLRIPGATPRPRVGGGGGGAPAPRIREEDVYNP